MMSPKDEIQSLGTASQPGIPVVVRVAGLTAI
jgi:hypothetical protein